MNGLRFCILILPVLVAACSSGDGGRTIAALRSVKIEIREEQIEDGLDKAMAGYEQFLAESEGSAMVPEAIRRLADLKVEKEYGYIGGVQSAPDVSDLSAPETVSRRGTAMPAQELSSGAEEIELEDEFEQRATQSISLQEPVQSQDDIALAIDDLERAGAREAIELYQKLLREYPLYERNDQVLYQMSRAYEELGQIDPAMEIMDQLVGEFPESRYFDEVQFRRAEYFFTRRSYLEAEDAYASIVAHGVGSFYYQLALYKLGWTFYKQELYEDGLRKFIGLLDYKVSVGYDFEQVEDEQERKRMEDTFRVISLSFSYLGGAEAVVDYFTQYGARSYEDSVYRNLAEYYFTKRRYSDAIASYSAFIDRNPFHRKAPLFHMRAIEINIAGGFPSLVIEGKKEFATRYGLQAEYWQHFLPEDRPEVLDFLKTNLTDLANHYHALYQEPKLKEKQGENFAEAQHWYREFLVSFPQAEESPVINHQLADLLLENRSFVEAAVEYERTAYDYPVHDSSSKAGYAAVYAYRQHLKTAKPGSDDPIRRDVISSSVRFADTFPQHEKADVVLGAAVDDLYDLKDFEQAVTVGRHLITSFPEADEAVRRAAWLVIGHSTYELQKFEEAETAYVQVLDLLPKDDKTRTGLIDNLAASIYKQGEQANAEQNYLAAAEHFLRVGAMAPTSKLRANAEYDAAVALIQLKDWTRSAEVLVAFRDAFPEHELQREVTKKIAYVYREDGKLALAAEEYERIERESSDPEIRREALLVAAELYEEVGLSERVLAVYQRYVGHFPQPVEINLETRNKIAELLKQSGDLERYLLELKSIVAIDASAGEERTPRTRYLAAKAALVLAEPGFERFANIQLVNPIKDTLRRKQKAMKAATKAFSDLLDYEVGDVTAAATYYLAEIYDHFSKALMASERPDGLSPLELEEYELAIEEQAYPFEEKAIVVHESNLELMGIGVYNDWIAKSLQKLAKLVPVRYAKPEQESTVLVSFETFSFEIVHPELHAEQPASEEEEISPDGEPEVVVTPTVAEPTAVEQLEASPLPSNDTQSQPYMTAASGQEEEVGAEPDEPLPVPDEEEISPDGEPAVVVTPTVAQPTAVEQQEAAPLPSNDTQSQPEMTAASGQEEEVGAVPDKPLPVPDEEEISPDGEPAVVITPPVAEPTAVEQQEAAPLPSNDTQSQPEMTTASGQEEEVGAEVPSSEARVPRAEPDEPLPVPDEEEMSPDGEPEVVVTPTVAEPTAVEQQEAAPHPSNDTQSQPEMTAASGQVRLE
ncbi:tetratricopeptide repeat protein [Malonomonas rubra]|uniref:tetratricopeptide repeat protein n=1 Tax=Malonomonas rubra TaxID=57040 RepID=UPI0026F0BA5A|nr:tetratricopeptide repeat protein [Malonomonas rubra]